MSGLNHYFQMNVDDVIEYTLEKVGEIPRDRDSVEAIVPSSHGNLDYVYRAQDGKGHFIYIKQARTEARISKGMKPSRDRNRLRSEIPMLEDKLVPGMVPHMYFPDTIMCAYGMEDCSDYVVTRDVMLRHETFPEFVEDVPTFMVNTLLLSSDITMDHKDKRELVKKFILLDLCDIMEKLVLMGPYNDLNNHNNVYVSNGGFVRRELYGDEAPHLEIAKLKFCFMTDVQTLLQGDFRTGSIFIRQDVTKIFDSEFETYAPMGYDIGNMITNLIPACNNGLSMDDASFCGWILKTTEKTVGLFIKKFSKKYGEAVTELMAKAEGFKVWYSDDILRDIAGYAGTELHHRTASMANAVDVTTITDEKKRLPAERINILVGKGYIMSQDSFRIGTDLVVAVKRAKEVAEKTL